MSCFRYRLVYYVQLHPLVIGILKILRTVKKFTGFMLLASKVQTLALRAALKMFGITLKLELIRVMVINY